MYFAFALLEDVFEDEDVADEDDVVFFYYLKMMNTKKTMKIHMKKTRK